MSVQPPASHSAGPLGSSQPPPPPPAGSSKVPADSDESVTITVGHAIEEGKRLSDSMLWPLTRRFYEAKGPAAWSSGEIPFYVTSNPFVANCYAQVVLAFLRDALRTPGFLDASAPIYIVEMAAGHGLLTFLFLRRFLPMLRSSSVRGLDVRYVMTDIAESNLTAWVSSPALGPYFEEGVLDCALFDAENHEEIVLRRSGVRLSVGQVKNPLIVFANYILDSLIQDAFRIRDGVLQEALVTLRHPSPTPPLSDPNCMADITAHYDYQPCALPRYQDPVFDGILESYRAQLADTHVLFPVGPLRCLSRLRDLSRDRLLLLSADKGYTEEEELFFLSDQYLQSHGCISTMVNYHALASYATAEKGIALTGSQLQQSLKCVALLFGRGDSALRDQFADTLISYATHADDFGPYDFYTHASAVRDSSSNLSMDGLFTLLRLSRFDPNVVLDNAQRILDLVPNTGDQTRRELVIMLERVYDNFVPIGRDLPFELARIYLMLNRPRDGIRFNELSLKLFGEHAVTWSNQALCYHNAEDDAQALHCLDRALQLDPENATARAWRARLRGLERRRQVGQKPANSNARPPSK